MKEVVYLTAERIIEYNLLALTLIQAKKADRSQLLSKAKLDEVVEGCKLTAGDIYDKAVYLLKGLIQKHPFASGNRRTAILVTKEFVLMNKCKFLIRDDPQQARVMVGIREGFYTDYELRIWIKDGKIRPFER